MFSWSRGPSTSKLDAQKNSPMIVSRCGLTEKPGGISLSYRPQISKISCIDAANTGFHFVMTRDVVPGSQSQFTLQQLEYIENKYMKATRSEEFPSIKLHCIGVLRNKIDTMLSKVINCFKV